MSSTIRCNQDWKVDGLWTKSWIIQKWVEWGQNKPLFICLCHFLQIIFSQNIKGENVPKLSQGTTAPWGNKWTCADGTSPKKCHQGHLKERTELPSNATIVRVSFSLSLGNPDMLGEGTPAILAQLKETDSPPDWEEAQATHLLHCPTRVR